MVRPVTLMVNKVIIRDEEHANLMFRTAQAAVARAVLDSVRTK
jgi:formaldehyde-activating enzyme